MSASRSETEIDVGVVVRRFELEGVEDGGALFVGEGLDLVFGFLGEVTIVALEWIGAGAFGSDGPVIASDEPFNESSIGFGGEVGFEPVDDVLGAGAVDRDAL